MDVFRALLQAAIRGEFPLATGDGVPSSGQLEVLMLSTAPGAVALHTESLTQVAVLDVLREVALRDYPHIFSAETSADLFAAERELWEAVWRDVDGEAVSLILIPGADALDLLRAIARVLNRQVH